VSGLLQWLRATQSRPPMNHAAYEPNSTSELVQTLARLESLQEQYAQAKTEMRDDEVLRGLVTKIDSAIEQLVRLTGPTR
jgi:hypothetical protein